MTLNRRVVVELMLSGIVFDFDGVILESADIKTRAFAALFDGFPGQVNNIVAYHTENAGLSRYAKFQYIHEKILQIPLSAAGMELLDRKFGELVYEEIRCCPYVPGVCAFLERRVLEYPLFVVSATPEPELRSIVDNRGLTRFFHGVHGSPTLKHSLLRSIHQKLGSPAEGLLFIGDGLEDYRAAVEVGTRFVGRALDPQRSPFASLPIVVVKDVEELESMWPSVADSL